MNILRGKNPTQRLQEVVDSLVGQEIKTKTWKRRIIPFVQMGADPETVKDCYGKTVLQLAAKTRQGRELLPLIKKIDEKNKLAAVEAYWKKAREKGFCLADLRRDWLREDIDPLEEGISNL